MQGYLESKVSAELARISVLQPGRSSEEEPGAGSPIAGGNHPEQDNQRCWPRRGRASRLTLPPSAGSSYLDRFSVIPGDCLDRGYGDAEDTIRRNPRADQASGNSRVAIPAGLTPGHTWRGGGCGIRLEAIGRDGCVRDLRVRSQDSDAADSGTTEEGRGRIVPEGRGDIECGERSERVRGPRRPSVLTWTISAERGFSSLPANSGTLASETFSNERSGLSTGVTSVGKRTSPEVKGTVSKKHRDGGAENGSACRSIC